MKKREIKNDMLKEVNADTNEVFKFILILVGVAAISLALFFVTDKYLIKEKVYESTENINYSQIKIGNIFNRKEGNYYVLAYDSDSENANYYSSLISNAKGKVIYTLDLSVKVNAKHKGDSNRNATKPEELSISEPTLIEIQNGKIVNYYDTEENIVSILK